MITASAAYVQLSVRLAWPGMDEAAYFADAGLQAIKPRKSAATPAAEGMRQFWAVLAGDPVVTLSGFTPVGPLPEPVNGSFLLPFSLPPALAAKIKERYDALRSRVLELAAAVPRLD